MAAKIIGLLALLVFATSCAGTGSPRFVRTHELDVVDSTWQLQRVKAVPPVYPKEARESEKSDTVIVAYVVDTTGRVEYRTISVLRRPRDYTFTKAVCYSLARFQLSPPPTARMLVVQPFAFTIGEPPGPLDDLSKRYSDSVFSKHRA